MISKTCTALVLVLGAALPVAPASAALQTPVEPSPTEECEAVTTHHDVHDENGVLIGIQTVKTTRNCLTYTSYHPIPTGN